MGKSGFIFIMISIGAPCAIADIRTDFSQEEDRDLQIKACSEIIRSDPDVAGAYNNRANAYWSKREYELAAADYERAIELDPSDPLTYSNCGSLYLERGKYDLAIADFDRALTINSNDTITRQERLNAYVAADRLGPAAAELAYSSLMLMVSMS
jgi:tetratricopeptide (TPR) repeat protein